MPNCYTDLNLVKSFGVLNITGTSTDQVLLDAIEEGSRQMDIDTERFYYIYEGTFYQDGAANRLILDWDVQTISTLSLDLDGSMQYASDYTVDINSPSTAPDVFCYPFNRLPVTHLEANPFGNYGQLGSGYRKSIKITGTFGYGNDWPKPNYHVNGNYLSSAMGVNSTSMVVTTSTGNPLSAGMTIKVGTSDQIFISGYTSSTTFTVQRAQNGTSAVACATTDPIYIYDYPQAIEHCVTIYAIRNFKRRESAYANVISNALTGDISVYKKDDPDWVGTVLKYRKARRGWYL